MEHKSRNILYQRQSEIPVKIKKPKPHHKFRSFRVQTWHRIQYRGKEDRITDVKKKKKKIPKPCTAQLVR